MLLVSFIFSAALLTLLVAMIFLAMRYNIFYARHLHNPAPHHNPKVGILLPLRGPDPFLARCLAGLLEQDYPDYVVRIVVDNPQDPAREIVEDVIREKNSPNATVEFLEDFTDTCSLRSCALRQAYKSLPNDCEVIIQVDGDVCPYPTWISDLVGGLEDPEVGVACGIRWFSPRNPTLPNLVRHVWNAGAILQMQPLNIGWGGSFAIKKEAFEKARIYELWGSALFDDTYSTDLILQQGYKLNVLPSVTMVNEESTNLKGCLIFISRQLLNLRLSHRAWTSVCVSGLGMGLVTSASVLFCILAFALGEILAGQIVLATLVASVLLQALLTWGGELLIHRSLISRERAGVKFSPCTLPIAVAMALVVYPLCLLHALRTKRVVWRGITYEIYAPQQVKRLNYEPYQATESVTEHSL